MVVDVECDIFPNSGVDVISVRVNPEDEDYILGVGIHIATPSEFPVRVSADPNDITPYILAHVRSTPSLSKTIIDSELKKIGLLNPLTYTIYSEIESAWATRKPNAQNKYFSLRGELVHFIEDQHATWCRVCVEAPGAKAEGYYNMNMAVMPYLRNKLFSTKIGAAQSMVVVTSSQKSDVFPFTLIYMAESPSDDSRSIVSGTASSVGKISLG